MKPLYFLIFLKFGLETDVQTALKNIIIMSIIFEISASGEMLNDTTSPHFWAWEVVFLREYWM